jgi:chromosome segregation ATPase
VDKENNEIETENKKMQKSIETLKVTARRVNQLEAENLDLEATHHKVERENKSLLREMDRLRQAVEVKDLSIDENSAKLASTERDVQKLKKELETVTKKDTKMSELEAANADLASTCMMDKKALIDLREELVQEKVTAEQLAAQLETVMTQLQTLGVTANEDGGLSGLDRVQMVGSEKEANPPVTRDKFLYSRSKV